MVFSIYGFPKEKHCVHCLLCLIVVLVILSVKDPNNVSLVLKSNRDKITRYHNHNHTTQLPKFNYQQIFNIMAIINFLTS